MSYSALFASLEAEKKTSKRKLHVAIITGNPKYIDNQHAKNYYDEIESFLKENGVDGVSIDPGEAQTLPDEDADFYIGHSRGAGREEYMTDENKKRFLKFGHLDGYIHPKDRAWQKAGYPGGKPPKEHFVFTNDQKQAIVKMIKYASKNQKS